MPPYDARYRGYFWNKWVAASREQQHHRILHPHSTMSNYQGPFRSAFWGPVGLLGRALKERASSTTSRTLHFSVSSRHWCPDNDAPALVLLLTCNRVCTTTLLKAIARPTHCLLCTCCAHACMTTVDTILGVPRMVFHKVHTRPQQQL